MLDELCALSRLQPQLRGAAAARAGPRAGAAQASARRGPRAPTRASCCRPCARCGRRSDGLCGKRLAAVMADTIAALERHGELELSRRAARSCSAPPRRPPSTACWPPSARRLRLKGRALTKPGSLLRSQIPVRTFAEWDHGRAGFLEIDLVAHEGGDPRGEFAYSLCATDVASGWTEPRVVRNRARSWTFEALLDVRRSLPFPLLGIDSDNGGEFINNHLAEYCAAERDHLHPQPALRSKNDCLPRRAEELERGAPRDRLRTLRHRGRARPDRRDLRRPAPLCELLPALA